MLLEFAKMHGLGNDFMVIDLVTQECAVSEELARCWGDRRTGVGFDQLLLIEPPTEPEADFRFRIFNSDGSEVQQCGNGARCVAWYVAHRELSPKPELTLQTRGGPIVTRLMDDDLVEVDMGLPRTEAAAVPVDPTRADVQPVADRTATYELTHDGATYRFTTVSMGNPHAVLMVENVASAPVDAIGSALVAHPVFPEGANIGFCEVVDRGFVRLRVYERGVGETRACGTGACAAAVAARLLGDVGERVKVSLPGGKVRISWQGPGSAVRMLGPASLVYEGRIQAPGPHSSAHQNTP
ncbi:MAG: diaminopimelate epimerase [Pseudomonadales bacterium]